MKSLFSRILILTLSLQPASWTASAEDQPLPENVQRLKQNYEQAVERSTAQVKTQYDAQMNRLLQKYTQAGKLDEAVALKAEIAQDPRAPADQTKLPLSLIHISEPTRPY